MRRIGAQLWATKPELRDVLAPHLLYTVCDEYKRAFRRAAEHRDDVDHASWFAVYPDLAGAIEPFVIQRARQFRQASALDACLVWIRQLHGGDDAWDQLANVWRWQVRHGTPELELSEDEAKRLNADLDPSEHIGHTTRHRDEADLGRQLQDVVRASQAFAQFVGEPWTTEDDERYAAALWRLPERAQHAFRTRGCTDALRKIASCKFRGQVQE